MAIGPDRRTMTPAQTRAAEIDVGLRSYMLRVYNYMSLGVAFTGIVSLLVAMNPAVMQAVVGGPFVFVLIIGVLGLGWFAPRLMMSGSVITAQACFWVYAGLWGALIAPYFYIYTGDSIARVFFISAGAFAGLSLFGYTTKRNLAPLGAFFTMAFIGVIIALFVNFLLVQSAGFDLLISVIAVLLFAGVTAYYTQMIKGMYAEADAGDVATRKAIFGAFALYGAFIGLFIYLLHIFGVMRD